jgi:hypothetical protein
MIARQASQWLACRALFDLACREQGLGDPYNRVGVQSNELASTLMPSLYELALLCFFVIIKKLKHPSNVIASRKVDPSGADRELVNERK